MMQTEPDFEVGRGQASSTTPATTPATTRTRCPACQKLFAVETESLNRMARAGATHAEFSCTGALCRATFAIALPLAIESSGHAVVPAKALDWVAASAPEVTPVPARVRAVPLKQPAAVVFDRECPRCGTANPSSSSECVRCEVVFEKILDERIEDEVALGGTRELSALWDKAMEDYEDRIRHDRFLNAARDGGALSYAAKKYSQILVATPQDDIARHMRNRVVALISVRAESSRMPFRLGFRIPKLNSMALFGGSLLFFWGLFMPQLKSIMEIGLSLMLLSIGVRLALRARL